MGNITDARKKFMILLMVVLFVAGTIMVEADTCDCIMCGSFEFCCGSINSNAPLAVCTTCMTCGTTQWCCDGNDAPAPSPSLWSWTP
ncbi:hypothetical protein SUGI_1139370 [Cryptomeria japonica]|nr:hypothetical protein SUGI_1139370 [Cryptomeria japonica]